MSLGLVPILVQVLLQKCLGCNVYEYCRSHTHLGYMHHIRLYTHKRNKKKEWQNKEEYLQKREIPQYK